MALPPLHRRLGLVATSLALGLGPAASTGHAAGPGDAPPAVGQVAPLLPDPDELFAGTPFSLGAMMDAARTEIEGSPLVLREALATALAASPDLREALLGPVIGEAELGAREGVYALTLFAEGSASRSVAPSASALSGAAAVEEDRHRFGGGLRQPLPFSGGQIELRLDHEVRETNSSFTALSPEYRPTLSLGIRQPLLRDLLVDRRRADIEIAEAGLRISRLELERSVRDLVLEVEEGYWGLRFALADAVIKRLAVLVGEELVESNRRRHELGVLPYPEVVDLEATLAGFEDDLVRAQGELRVASDRLRRTLGLPLDGTLLIPAEAPTAPAPLGPLEPLLTAALEARTDVRRAGEELTRRATELRLADDRLLPELDLEAGAGLTGLAGTGRTVTFGDTTQGSAFEGSFTDGYDELASGDFYDWSVGLSFSVPLTTDAADRGHDRARLERRVAELRLDRARRDARLDVRNAYQRARTGAARVDTTQTSLDKATANLRAEARRYQLGTSRTDDVIRKLLSYTEAWSRTARARAEAQVATARLRRATARNLEEQGVHLPEPPALEEAMAGDWRSRRPASTMAAEP